MGKLIESLGIDPWILFAQLFNFVLLLLILRKFAYKSIVEFVADRTQKIEDGLKNAENATAALAQAQEEQQRVIDAAQAEGRSIVEEARKNAERQAQELLTKNAEHIDALNKKNTAALDALKMQMMNEVRAQATDLICAAVEKILREKMTSEEDKKLVAAYLKEHK